MQIKRLQLENFGGFVSLDLDLDRPLTVLVGANGSGKSTILQAIAGLVSTIQHGGTPPIPAPWLRPGANDLRLGAKSGRALGTFLHQGLHLDYCIQKPDMGTPWSGSFVALPPGIFFEPGHLFLFLVDASRSLTTATLPDWKPKTGFRWGAVVERSAPPPPTEAEDLGVFAPYPGYARFLEWFKEHEDIENEQRVATGDLSTQDPELRAVRDAVAELMPGFDRLRILRKPTPVMVVTKNGLEFRLDQLSDGERNLIAMTGDLARRLVAAHGPKAEPRQAEGIVLIDEVDQHLHPAWQRKVLPALQRAFPKVQFIVTTHSPQVLSSVAASSIVLLHDFEAHALTEATRGRDTNAILRDVFGVPERPEEQVQEIAEITRLIDSLELDEARGRLTRLAVTLSEHDDAVLSLRTRLDFAEAGL